MKKESIWHILQSHEWKEEEAGACVFLVDLWKTIYLEQNKAYGRKLYSFSIYSVVDHYALEWVKKDEARGALQWAVEIYGKDKKFFHRKLEAFHLIESKIKAYFEEIQKNGLEHFSNRQLIALIDEFQYLGKTYYAYSLLTEGLDVLDERDWEALLPSVPKSELATVLRVLGNPPEITIVEREKRDLFLLAREVFKDKKLQKVILSKRTTDLKNFPRFFRMLQKHTDQYVWLQNNFRGAIHLNIEHFVHSLAEIVRKENVQSIKKELRRLKNKQAEEKKLIEKVYRKYALSRFSKRFFEFVRFLAILQDWRKETTQRFVFCVDMVLREATKRYGVPKKDLENYFVVDLKRLFQKNTKVPRSVLVKRQKVLFVSYREGKEIKSDYVFGKDADAILAFFEDRKKSLISEGIIKGFTASRGNHPGPIQGIARIIFDPHKESIKPGEILVTGMTRPEFVSLMKKAAAIITNEGGITTHAAIISRELGKPCIIGTKIATKVLKDGDRVEVDVERGIVRILK